MRFSIITLVLAMTSHVLARGFGASFQGYNWQGFYPIAYAKNSLRLSGREFGSFDPVGFASWISLTKCNINGVVSQGEICARGMIARAVKDAANGVVTASGDSANMIAITNETASKTYVQTDLGQGPSVSGIYTGDTPPSCQASPSPYTTGDSQWYPGFRGVKATCKVACGESTFDDTEIDSVLDQLFNGIKNHGVWMSHFVLWRSDTGAAKVRCRLTINDRWQDADGCPDAVPGMGCTPSDAEKNP
ncbi:hypothetical protein B9Z65_175 [Elsinoe australis]|uniref:Uncharacterized protein n=1 Tax=Elsinoe australis TaxID=40998 RepID=A0A2P7Z7K5_9PEZI|nr:hypothetical protein B9Z65_175 [Elsinoe australis]